MYTVLHTAQTTNGHNNHDESTTNNNYEIVVLRVDSTFPSLAFDSTVFSFQHFLSHYITYVCTYYLDILYLRTYLLVFSRTYWVHYYILQTTYYIVHNM